MNKQLYKQVSKHFQEIDEIPLFGNAPPLNLKEISFNLSKQFGIEDLCVHLKEQKWTTLEKTKTKQIEIPIHLSPIDTPLYWIMTKADRDKFIEQMMFQKTKKAAFSSSALQEGFYQFILLEALSAAQSLEPIKQMSLQLGEKSPLPEEDGIMIAVEITFGNFSTWGKLFIPNIFRETWVQHFAAFPPQYVTNNLSKQIPLELGVKVGEVELPVKEWKKLKPGDFLFPDTFAPEKGTLLLGETPLFHLEAQENTQMKLRSYAFNPEDSMEEDTPQENAPANEKEAPHVETLSHTLETAENEAKSIKEIPLQVSIELARLKITLDELMNLSPGNLLKIPALAEKRVTLVANGQKIGVAEIVELEESLGLKILEI